MSQLSSLSGSPFALILHHTFPELESLYIQPLTKYGFNRLDRYFLTDNTDGYVR
jgi:hypothetical protein